ncbi:IclR family transcriptional regulator [Streptomyces sp. HNM0574]|uniref:IclR family transcriptional regulator n=1 Tax=Streptomyces sp. HNM0574 TaxID=2714954 RepID=UPI00146E4378|nr:IclR family transcriptional regulator [Streptomyces sp. HNM0574]NLU69185.1 IclR family transcriptional regulator [Streptomyces sp. HNM0574]
MSQTVRRAVEILEHLSQAPRSQMELGEHLGVHRSTALRLLEPLVEGGLARRLPDGKYALGHRLAGMAQLAREQFGLREVASPHLRALGESCGHTVHLAVLEDDSIVYADKVEPVGTVRLYSQIGRPVTLHTAGVAKAILSHLDRDRARGLLGHCDFVAHTGHTHTSLTEYERVLDEALERGWARDDGEFEDYVNCVAAPVRDATGEVVAAVSVTALKVKADLDALRTGVLDDLLATTSTISKELGWRP